MKKALLAVLIPSLLGASSAFAGGIDLIKNDDITLNFNGDIDLKSYTVIKDGDSAGTDTEVIFDDIDFDITYNVNEDLKLISGIDLTADGKTTDAGLTKGESGETNDLESVAVDLIWVGFASDTYGKAIWGNIETSWDSLGIDNSELDGGVASGWLDGAGTTHTNAIRYDYTIGDLVIGGTYGIPGDERASNKLTQLTLKYTPGDLLIYTGIGQTTTYSSNSAESDKSIYASLEIEYDFGDYTAAVLLTQEEQDIVSGTDISSTGFEVDFTYQLTSKVKLAAGADFITQDIDGKDDFTYAYAAAVYKFNKLASIRYELARADGDVVRFVDSEQNKDNEIKTGILVNLQF